MPMVQVFVGESECFAVRLNVLSNSRGADNGNRYRFRISTMQNLRMVRLSENELEFELTGDWEAQGLAQLFSEARKALSDAEHKGVKGFDREMPF